MFKRRMTWAVFACMSGIVALFGGLAGNANAGVVYTFNSVSNDMIDSRTGSFFSLPAEAFDITNNTGVTWTDFHMSLVGFSNFGSYKFMQFGDVGPSGIYTGPGTATFTDLNGDTLNLNDGMTIDGLSIANGSVLSFTVDIFGGVPEGLTSFEIWAEPSVASTGSGSGSGTGTGQVPEPASLALFAFGLAGLGFVRRRRMT